MIKCEEVCKRFGGVMALDRVSLSVSGNRMVGLIGPNGAGKTTLFGILSGFLRPDSGRAFIGDREVSYRAPYRVARQGLARTFQEVRLIRAATAGENLAICQSGWPDERFAGALLGARSRGTLSKLDRRATECLEFVGLSDAKDIRAGELSYGEQKLLSLACCLVREASVLLLDEPVAGVQPDLRTVILERLRELVASGKLVVFIEHDLDAVRDYCDLVALMAEGRILISGSPSDVLDGADILEAYIG